MDGQEVDKRCGPACGSSDSGINFLLPVVLGFFLLGLIILLRHEMWQDEWQAWLIAQESTSLADLFRNLRYEGHPGLWYLCLFLISRVTSYPLGMQLLHLVLATCSVYVLCRYAPFSRLQKILFVFGYFPLYEYAVISRNYALGVLGLFSFCAVFCTSHPRRYLVLAGILFWLCQTNVYALIISMVLGVLLFWEASQDTAVTKGKIVTGLVIVLLGVCLSLIQLIPPADSGYAVGWKFDLEFSHLIITVGTLWKSYIPIPKPSYHFWGTNLIPDSPWQFLPSVMLFIFGLLLFIRQPVPLFLYVGGTVGILAFTYVKYPGSLRHHGHLFLLFIASLWLSYAYPQKRSFSSLVQALSDFCQANRDRVFSVFLAAHLLAGVAAASLDLFFPFSASKDAARFMQQHRLDGMVILGHEDDAASSVAGYLGGQIYYPVSQRWGSFVIWNQQRNITLEPKELLKRAGELSRQHQQSVLLVLNYELKENPDMLHGPFTIRLLQKFTNSIVPQENYYLYLVSQLQ